MDTDAMGERPFTAVILDDHEVVTEGLRGWCESASPPITLVDATKLWMGPGATADVTILDLSITRDKKEFAELQRLVAHDRRVVVYSGDEDACTILRCIDIGALAYITKAEGKKHFLSALRAAADGLPYTGPSHSGAIASDTDPNRPHIPPRELEVMLCWFTSSSKAIVARRLYLSPRTVDNMIYRVRARYADVGRSAPTKTDLVARAIEDRHITWEELRGQGYRTT